MACANTYPQKSLPLWAEISNGWGELVPSAPGLLAQLGWEEDSGTPGRALGAGQGPWTRRVGQGQGCWPSSPPQMTRDRHRPVALRDG